MNIDYSSMVNLLMPKTSADGNKGHRNPSKQNSSDKVNGNTPASKKNLKDMLLNPKIVEKKP